VSSAILYVAIVAIWACVLIPRWLRRDSAHQAVRAPGDTTPGDTTRGDTTRGDTVQPGSVQPSAVQPSAVQPSAVQPSAVPPSAVPPGDVPVVVVAADGPANSLAVPDRDPVRSEAATHQENTAKDPPEQESAPQPLTPEESRRRMLSARRRLLGMLIALETAAISLAVLSLAALWVVIPPSVMLGGYLMLLREAAHADAERAEQEREAGTRTRTRAQDRAQARARAARHGVATRTAPPGASGPMGAAAPAAPGAAQYDDGGPGRDFAPGLAGKYTTSNAHVIDISGRADEESPHEPPEQKLRAVGD
jgi:hypothetical protein